MNSTDFGIFQVFGGLNLVFNFYHGKTGQMQMFQAQEVDKKIRKSIKREKKEQLFGRLETSWQHHEIGPFVMKKKEMFQNSIFNKTFVLPNVKRNFKICTANEETDKY